MASSPSIWTKATPVTSASRWSRGGQKESLSSLAPEWEQALESDLSRAIAGVDASSPPVQLAAKADGATLDAVRRAIPNLDTVSVEEGSRLLRAAAVTRFEQASQEIQARVKPAEEHFVQAQNSQSEAEQEEALKALEQVRKEQTKKIEDSPSGAKAQVEALQQLKGAAH